MKAKRKYQSGFTLLEVLIASALMLTAMALTMSFMSGFSRVGNRAILQGNMDEQLRSGMSRLEREIIEGVEVLSTSTNNRLVLSVPLYNASGFIVVDANGKPVVDTVTIEAVDDLSSQPFSHRSGSIRPQMIRYSLVPSIDSKRKAISNQVIVRDLMPKAAGISGCPTGEQCYSCPTGVSCFPAGSPTRGTFTYYQRDGVKIDPSSNNFDDISQVKILLWGERGEGRTVVTTRKDFEVRLRNWRSSAP